MRRPLTLEEIVALEQGGSSSPDWSLVEVSESFEARWVRGCRFEGRVSLGSLGGELDVPGLGPMRSELLRSTLRDVTLGAQALIVDATLVQGYNIGHHFALVGCRLLSASSEATYGLGTAVRAVCEAGGREVRLSRHLTSNVAYIVAMHGYREGLREAYDALIEAEVAQAQERGAVIGNEVTIVGCGVLRDVCLDDGACLEGVSSLRNGTVCSAAAQPTYIGANVTAENFVLAEGARLDTGASLHNAFVGENCRVADGFLCDNCLVFCHSELVAGEGVSAFCGPFTVSHHRGSLLIAGLYSFYNAGSATNASNHQYRLGPTQQGIYQRGVKTGSGAYLLLPANIGAFSLVVGHHKVNPDIGEFPFSVLQERGGESHLVPAQLVRSIGLWRDSQKWKRRDQRLAQRDAVTYDVLSPLTVADMTRAIERINNELLPREGEYIIECGLRLRRGLLTRAVREYQLALDVYLGKAYLRQGGQGEGLECHWVDCGGLVCPDFEVARIEERLVRGGYDSVLQMADDFRGILLRVREQTLDWCVAAARAYYGYSDTEDDLKDATQRLAEASAELREGNLADAAREWAPHMRVGYGLDDPTGPDADFRRLHGQPDDNPDVREMMQYYDFGVRD